MPKIPPPQSRTLQTLSSSSSDSATRLATVVSKFEGGTGRDLARDKELYKVVRALVQEVGNSSITKDEAVSLLDQARQKLPANARVASAAISGAIRELTPQPKLDHLYDVSFELKKLTRQGGTQAPSLLTAPGLKPPSRGIAGPPAPKRTARNTYSKSAQQALDGYIGRGIGRNSLGHELKKLEPDRAAGEKFFVGVIDAQPDRRFDFGGAGNPLAYGDIIFVYAKLDDDVPKILVHPDDTELTGEEKSVLKSLNIEPIRASDVNSQLLKDKGLQPLD